MDPVSALSVVGVAIQLAGLCVSVPRSLGGFKDRYDEAGRTIRGIKQFCKVIEIAAGNIATWLKATPGIDQGAVPELGNFQSVLVEFVCVVQALKDDADKYAGSTRAQRFRLAWNQEVMQQHLQELHYLSGAFHLLLDSTKLSLDQLPEIVRRMEADAQSIPGSRRSLKSIPVIETEEGSTLRFAFEEVLASSSVYQRVAAYTQVPAADPADKSSSSLDAITPGKRPPSPHHSIHIPAFSGPQQVLPLRRNHKFWGREAELNAISYRFRTKDPSLITFCKLYGMGGVGKTQIALEYAYQSTNAYDAIFWIPAESSIQISMHYLFLSQHLGLTTSSDPEVGVGLFRAWLRSTTARWLLVFDNLHDDIPPLSATAEVGGSVLITTRKTPEVHEPGSIKVDTFSHGDGVEFFLRELKLSPRSLSDTEATLLDRAVEGLGRLPLALVSAAGYSHNSGSPFVETLQALSQFLDGHPYPIVEYETKIGDVLSVTFAGLSIQATAFMQTLAFLDPDEVPRILWEDLTHFDEKNHWQIFEVVEELALSSLIALHNERDDPQGRHISLHRVIRRYILSSMNHGGTTDTQTTAGAFNRALVSLRKHLPSRDEIRSSSEDAIAQHAWVFPHMTSLATTCAGIPFALRPPSAWVDMLLDCAGCAARTGDWALAKTLLHFACKYIEDRPELSTTSCDSPLAKRATGMQNFIEDLGF